MHCVGPDSLQIIMTLIQDKALDPNPPTIAITTNNNFRTLGYFFVGSSRPVNDYKSLEQLVEEIPRNTITFMSVFKLSVNEISDICCNLLHKPNKEEADEMMEFATCMQRKAGGNAFVVLQYLRLLEEKKLIFYDEEKKQQQQQ